ncbi:MAG: class I SAM-dependent rRNA methyltransferase [Ignavibacteriae bacterium]|nr:class I SAM-dependent rRNA methyltransferase [Ignavibacteriota bacterium]MCB9215161.1 class I SAM-dependent rRNA methyltransferase [Ignavibacteria bacterium]
MSYPSLTLLSGRDRSVVNRHPWVFSGAIKSHPKAGLGEIIAVKTNHDQLLGYGFHNPNSRIICRLFEFTSEEREFDREYWIGKVRTAWKLRQRFLPPDTNCFRLLHAEGDFLPGVIADVYGDVLVLQILTKGGELILDHLLEGFQEIGFQNIYLKNKEAAERFEQVNLENGWLRGEGEAERVVREHGLEFRVDFGSGQKTGFFLDQRENRLLLQNVSRDARVLNAFSYTGGFSLYALAGGAAVVDSVDVSSDAVALADENVRRNVPDAKHNAIVADCFDFLRREGNLYDIVVLDPPAFARTPKAVQRASRGYKDLNLHGIKQLRPGGLLFTFSCSGVVDRDLFRKIVFGAAADAGRDVRILHQLSQPFDHPINIYHPEGEYLKGLVLEVGE